MGKDVMEDEEKDLVAEFLAGGGVIEKIPYGKMTDSVPVFANAIANRKGWGGKKVKTNEAS